MGIFPSEAEIVLNFFPRSNFSDRWTVSKPYAFTKSLFLLQKVANFLVEEMEEPFSLSKAILCFFQE